LGDNNGYFSATCLANLVWLWPRSVGEVGGEPECPLNVGYRHLLRIQRAEAETNDAVNTSFASEDVIRHSEQ